MRFVLPFALLGSILVTMLPGASAVPPDDLFLFFDLTETTAYTNGSTVEAWAALSFSGTPDPPPQVDNIGFAWYAPNGTLAKTALIDPDASGFALSSYRVDAVGAWSVNATYLGTPTLWTNRTVTVIPATWSGTVILSESTMVGGLGSLSVTPGTTIRMHRGVNFRVKGTVFALGNPGNPVVLTSNASSPAPGDWGGWMFLPGSEGSRIDEVRVQYASNGTWLAGAAPELSNVSVADGLRYGFRFDGAIGRFSGVAVVRTPTAVLVAGGAVSFDGLDLRDVSYGVLATATSLEIVNATIENGAQTAIDLGGGSLSVRNLAITGGGVGIRLQDSTGTLDGLDVLDADEAVAVSGISTISITNSTFGNAGTRHLRVLDTSTATLTNATFETPGELVTVDATAHLTLWNYLWIVAESFDNGSRLPGIAVEVRRNGAILFSGLTNASGTIPPLILLHREYGIATGEGRFMVSLAAPGIRFADNGRIFEMATSRVELFLASTEDLDGDGDPDFADPDIDGDGLDNEAEGIIGTDPRDDDSDGDGLPDGWEFDYQQNPMDGGDRDADADGDGLTNAEEYDAGSDPRTTDTDGDRMPDGWEATYGLNPGNRTDSGDDPDADGFSNLEEFLGGSHPLDAGSTPRRTDFGALWPFIVALVAAFSVIVLSLVLNKRAKPEPPNEETK